MQRISRLFGHLGGRKTPTRILLLVLALGVLVISGHEFDNYATFKVVDKGPGVVFDASRTRSNHGGHSHYYGAKVRITATDHTYTESQTHHDPLYTLLGGDPAASEQFSDVALQGGRLYSVTYDGQTHTLGVRRGGVLGIAIGLSVVGLVFGTINAVVLIIGLEHQPPRRRRRRAADTAF